MRVRLKSFFYVAAVLVVVLCIMVNGYMERTLNTAADAAGSDDYISIQTGQGIQEISFEDYAVGVAACQIDLTAPAEAIKAQIVIARTNLCKKMADQPEQLLSESYRTRKQLKELGVLDSFSEAGEATAGQVLKVDEQLVYLPYHQISAGKTRAGAEVLPEQGYDWLLSADCSSDQNSAAYLKIEVLKPSKVIKKINEQYPDSLEPETELEEQLEIVERDSTDYVKWVRIGSRQISGEAFSQALGLSSSCFFIDTLAEGLRITTKGVGHGLGLSQYQGMVMAQAGSDYQKILSTFFAKAKLGSR